MPEMLFNLILAMASSSNRDGMINTPEHFHNAFLYEGFMFLDAIDQAYFEKICEDLDKDIKEKGLAAVSWAIFLGFLRMNEKSYKVGDERTSITVIRNNETIF